MSKLGRLNCQLLIFNLWWCILIGLIIPQTPSWGLPIVIVLAISMIIVLSILLFKQTRQAIRGAISKIFKMDSMPLTSPLTMITGVFASLCVSLALFFSKNLPTNILEFTLLVISSIWGWLEIASRTGIKLQSSFSTFHSIVIILNVSLVGIAIGWLIYVNLNDQILGALFFVFIGSLIVDYCIPD